MASVNIKKLTKTAKMPLRGSNHAAGYDLYADLRGEDFVLVPPHKTMKIGTGLAIEIPDGYFGGVFARSGLATREGLRPANAVGVIDSDYRNELIVAIHNDTDVDRFVNNGERIAQLVVLPHLEVDFVEVDELSITSRGMGGFGSTGKK